jgi:hypothetical protein
MKTYLGIRYYDGGVWSGSRPGRFTPGIRDPVTHWIEGWVGHKAGVKPTVKRKNSIITPAGNWTPVAHPVP